MTKSADLAPFLAVSDVIDHDHPLVRDKAAALISGLGEAAGPAEVARTAFLFVRDAIRHSIDFRQNPVTCAASDVLRHGTGYCYAKAHLLVALLRACRIPAGLAYQRLLLDPVAWPGRFCLHGLAAVHLSEWGWYRIDPRGNKAGVDARFTPPVERLAFTPTAIGETDLPDIHAEPLPVIVAALRRHRTWDALLADLPDCPV